MESLSNPNIPTVTSHTGTASARVISMRIELLRTIFKQFARRLALTLPVLGVFVAATPAFAQQNATDPTAVPALRVSPGDLLAVDVFDTPELSAKLRVSENGDIDLPVAGLTHVGGFTAEEAAARIENRFRDENILKHPHVEVFEQEY